MEVRRHHAFDRLHGLIHDDVEDLGVSLAVLAAEDSHTVSERCDGKLTFVTDAEDERLAEHGDVDDVRVLELLGRTDVHAGVIVRIDDLLDVASACREAAEYKPPRAVEVPSVTPQEVV